MKKLKQILAVLVIGTLLFTACDNRDEVEEVEQQSPCNYTFIATPATQDLEINVDGTITLNIAKQSNISCSTKYKMTHTITHNGNSTLNSLFVYGGDATDVTIGDTSGTFNTSVIGTYVIEFTMTNDGADTNKVQTETVTINVTYPPIVITPNTGSTIDTVYAKQTATYEFDLTGGDTANSSFEVKVEADASNLNSVLEIDGTAVNFGTFITVSNPFTLTLTPNALEATTDANVSPEVITPTNFELTVRQLNVTEVTEIFVLKARMPRFDTNLDLSRNSINANSGPSFSRKSDLDIDVTLEDSYSENLTYNYSVAGTVLINDGNSSTLTDIMGNPEPNQQTFEIKALNSSATGTRTIGVTVTNQFAFSVYKEITITIN